MQWLIELVADLVRSELVVPKAIGYFGSSAPFWTGGITYHMNPDDVDYDPEVMFEVDAFVLPNAAEAFYRVSWNINLYPSISAGKYVIIIVLLNEVETMRWVRYCGSAGQFGINGSCFLRCPVHSQIKLNILHNNTNPVKPWLSARVSQVAIHEVL